MPVPVFGPDGQVYNTPDENVQAALAGGGKLAVHVYSPDGEAHYVPHDKLGDALKAGATYSPSQPSDVAPRGFAQSLAATIPNMAQGLYHNFADAPRTTGEVAIKGTNDQSGLIARTLGQFGLGGYRTLVAPAVANGRAAIADAQSPNLSNRMAAASEAIGAIPIIGSGVDAGRGALQQYLSGDRSGAAGNVAGNLIAAGIGGAMGSELGAPPAEGTLSPLERASVGVTKAINPPVAAFSNLDDAIRAQGSNVLDYAKRNNLPITDARDFGKVAQLAADQARKDYQETYLEPHANKEVSVTGSGYQGRTRGEGGQRATLGDVDQRINAINRELRSNFRKPTAGQVASAGASDAELEAEHGTLANILHKSLGDLNGVEPNEIRNLRIRGGQLSTIAGEARGASNALSAGAGKAEVGAGSGLPASTHGALQEIISRLPGMSREAVAARATRSSLRDLLAASQNDITGGR